LDVIALIAEGRKNRDIAARLFISQKTVGHHVSSIFDKLGLAGRLELLLYAWRHHLVTISPLPVAGRHSNLPTAGTNLHKVS
jgi:DNA-binding NarL/FixJ family response regulator